MARLLERLKTDILVADGAMGTLLYRDGLNTCYEAYNLKQPKLVKEVHASYIEAGADVIQTNTYGAKGHKLKAYGLEDQVKDINQAGARLAREVAGPKTFVLGTIGGSRGVRECDLSLEEIVEETLEQAHYLLETGLLDGLLLETYYDIEELEAVLKALRPKTELPILANISLQEVGLTESGQSLADVFQNLIEWVVDVLGLNCHLGPYHMIQSLKQVPLYEQAYIAVYPNASLMGVDTEDGPSYQFASNAEYFGKSALLLAQEGARLIGGCCGPTPAHIRAAKRALRGMTPVLSKEVDQSIQEDLIFEGLDLRSPILDQVQDDVTVIVELDPPKHLQIDGFQKALKALDKTNIAAITLADNSLARTRVCNLSLASYMKEQVTKPFLLHLSCRDHNMIGLQSRLMGMDLLGFHDVLALTGDPSRMGDFPGATSVYDVTSFKLIELIKGLNLGQSYSGASLKKGTHFTVAAAFNPNIESYEAGQRLLAKKLEAGADYLITQPVFSKDAIQRLAAWADGIDKPIFVGIMPITGFNNANFLHNEVPGIQLSKDFLERLERVQDDKAASRTVVLEECQALLDECLKYFKGIYLITPFMRYDLILDLLDYIDSKEAKGLTA